MPISKCKHSSKDQIPRPHLTTFLVGTLHYISKCSLLWLWPHHGPRCGVMWCGVGVACLVFGRRLALVGHRTNAIHTVCVPRLLGLDKTASVCNKMYLILNKLCLLWMHCRICAETKIIAYCSYACRVFSGDTERRTRGGGRAHSREHKSSRNQQKAGGKDPSANVRNFLSSA